ncbi:hypothetical protein GF369_04205 [Candidatus Peregrinibacteria bacterium]|nr:hypothetical protein [Candidatus Peregrinibacteria bacterium]
MFPVLIQIGPIIIYSLWLFAGLGFLLGVFIFTQLAHKKRLNINFIYNHSFGLFIWALIGSRLVFLIRNFSYYFPEFTTQNVIHGLFIWDKGLSLIGGLMGLAVALFYYTKKEKEQTKKWFDILTIAVLFALATGHLGTFLDGSAYGNITSLPWGMIFDNPSIKYAVPIHPIQLYSFLFTIILALSLFIYYRKKRPSAGKTTSIGVGVYSLYLFLQGFIRGDDVLIIAGLREEQWFGIIILIILIGVQSLKRYNNQRALKQSDPT